VPTAAVTISDESLVSRTLTGDLAAFDALVERHGSVVYRVALRIVGPADAEDVAQDALLRAFHGLGGFRGETPFRSWLLRITHNTALNAIARRRAEPVDVLPEEGATRLAAPGEERPPAEALEARERRERLETKLRLLPPAHRAVLVLRDLEGLTYDEIAEVTETPLGSVKGRLYRARGELVEILRNNTYDWELPA
jgi:RNA polymerase sigma-70 factor (ECF subfamily)